MPKLKLYKVTILKLKDFLEKYKLKNDTTSKSDLQKVFKYPNHPLASKVCSDEGFMNIDNGQKGGTYWTYFYIKDNKSFYSDSFGAAHDKFLLNQLSNPLTYHKYKIQDKNSR